MIDLEHLSEEDRQHIAEQIKNDCNEGELYDNEWRGWWKLSFEKWDNNEK